MSETSTLSESSAAFDGEGSHPTGTPHASFSPQQPVEAGWRRSFWALIFTQFQGAFSANTFEYFLLYLVVGMGLAKEQQDRLVSVIPLFFAAPFVLFSMARGFLAHRPSKRQITIATQLFEIPALSPPLPALFSHSPPFHPGRAALLSEHMRDHQAWVGVLLVALAGAGLASSVVIRKVPAAAPAKKFNPNVFSDLGQQIGIMRSDSTLLLAVIGNTYFWFLGTLFMQTVLVYGSQVFHAPPSQNVLLLAGVALGLCTGSALSRFLFGHKI